MCVVSKKLPSKPEPFDRNKWQPWWKSPKGQPYFDSALDTNDTGHDLICSVCGQVVHSNKLGHAKNE